MSDSGWAGLGEFVVKTVGITGFIVVPGAALFGPTELVTALGFAHLSQGYRALLGLTFLLGWTMAAVALFRWARTKLAQRAADRREKEVKMAQLQADEQARLASLQAEEQANERFRKLWNKFSNDEQGVLVALYRHQDVDHRYDPRVRAALDGLLKLGLVESRPSLSFEAYGLSDHGMERMERAMASMHAQELQTRLGQ